MSKFNTSNVEVRFIKNILKNTYLPILPTVNFGDYLVEGATYIYKNNVIKCEKSGVLFDNNNNIDKVVYVHRRDSVPENVKMCPTDGECSISGKTFICGMGPLKAAYKNTQYFSYSKLTPGVTYQYFSSSDKYDIETHIQLGKYLRWYRDTKGINLMPLYNCFTGEDTPFIHLKKGKIESGNDSSKTTWIVPAQLNKRYTIFVDSIYPVSIGGAFLNNFGRVQYRGVEGKKFLDELLESPTIEQTNSTYRRPINYRVDTNNPNLISYTNNFYIVIQTDKTHSNSIVVIEGDVAVSNSRVVTNREVFLDTQNYSLFNPPINSSMTLLPAPHQVPYSNRLIEFLTEHSITSEEDISKNIERVQRALGVNGRYKMIDDVWDDVLRFIIYNNYFKYRNDYYFRSSSLTQEAIRQTIKEKNIPERLLVYLKDESGVFVDENGNPVDDENRRVVVGLKNCKLRRDFMSQTDITGYVDKDVENSLFKYRSVL